MGAPNPNITWAQIFVAELARGGLRAVCIAPGSRSTPLTLAFAAHPAIRVYRHLDERSAAFFALGLALASEAPVALLCTSGTAGANFYPAIIEAHQSGVPLLVLTADRPPELRGSGANQTIDQIKMYGDHVLWSVELPVPEPDAPAVVVRHLRTLAARSLATADGLVKGPVHLNFPFRKPLEPAPGEPLATGELGEAQIPFTRFARGVLGPMPAQVDELAALVDQFERGLIICGPRCPTGDFPAAVMALAGRSGYPVLADPLSGVRFGPQLKGAGADLVVGGYDTFLAGDGPDWPEPELVIRFGAVPTSKPLNSYLDAIRPERRIHVREDGRWADDSHRIDTFLQADPALVCRQLADAIRPRPGSDWCARVRATESATWRALDRALADTFFDGVVMADLLAGLPEAARLFVGNSLPVRHLDQFARPDGRRLYVLANRGASGIDGNISTGLGAGAAGEIPLVMVLGDITFYHDLNGLLAVREQGLAPTIVLLHNDGGGIFHRLPVARHEPPFSRLFLTPHGLDFEPVVRMYGLEFTRVTDRAGFQRAFAAAMEAPAARVIEVRTDSREDHQRRLAMLAQIEGQRKAL